MTALIRKPAIWLTVVSVAVAALVAFGAQNYRLYLIHTGSMTPTIPVGSMVVVEKNQNPKIGDVISFRRNGDGEVTTHRFIGYTADGKLRTQGDANSTPDFGAIPRTSVIGPVVAAPPHIGSWIHFISRTTLGYVFDGLILLIMLLVLMKPARRGAHRRTRKQSGDAPVPGAPTAYPPASAATAAHPAGSPADVTVVMSAAEKSALRELLDA